ncbi:MAG: sensor histidine kinase [Planctomycetota bacterium]
MKKPHTPSASRDDDQRAPVERARLLVHEFANLVDGSIRSMEVARRRIGEGVRDTEALRHLGSVERALRHMSSLVQDASPLPKRNAESPASAELDALLDDAIAMVRSAVEAEGHTIDSADVGAWDVPTTLFPVFVNALRNAVEAMETPGTISVRAAIEGDSLSLEFLDTGSPTELADPFCDGETTKSNGSGVGLALCRDIVQGLGGTIELGARIDGVRGSRLRIALPIGSQGNGA